jgi:chemotaxis protein MotB
MSEHDDHQEESFFVSMTDIMVGLLFIFILIIMYFAVQAKIDAKTIEQITNELRVKTDLLEEMGLDQYTELKAYQDYISLQRTNILNWVSAYLREDGVQGVQLIEEQGILRLPEGVLFDSGEFQLEEGTSAFEISKSMARALGDVLPCSVLNSSGKPIKSRELCRNSFYHNKNMGFIQAIYVEGHTDNRPVIGGLQGDRNLTNNLKLSARRSTNTFDSITAERPQILEFYGPVLGDSALRFEPVLASSAYGEWRPADTNDTEEGRRSNRRIDLRIVMYIPPNVDAMQDFAQAIGEVLKTENDDG